MLRYTCRLLLLAVAVLLTANPFALAQSSGSTSLSGVVTDTGGGMIPGAAVVVKNDATGLRRSIPDLYRDGLAERLQDRVITGVRLLTATPQSIKARLEGARPRGSTTSGLPNNAINITLDGVSGGSAFQSTDGFLSMVRLGRALTSSQTDLKREKAGPRGPAFSLDSGLSVLSALSM